MKKENYLELIPNATYGGYDQLRFIKFTVPFPEDLKFAWSLIKYCDWGVEEQEKIKTCSTGALKLVYGKLKKNPTLYMDSLDQCGWKFKEELERRESDARMQKANEAWGAVGC
jgi:hypothetical protein